MMRGQQWSIELEGYLIMFYLQLCIILCQVVVLVAASLGTPPRFLQTKLQTVKIKGMIFILNFFFFFFFFFFVFLCTGYFLFYLKWSAIFFCAIYSCNIIYSLNVFFQLHSSSLLIKSLILLISIDICQKKLYTLLVGCSEINKLLGHNKYII